MTCAVRLVSGATERVTYEASDVGVRDGSHHRRDLLGNIAFATAPSAESAQRIRVRMGDQAVTATLSSSEAARDLVTMLPLSIRMRDHLKRGKTAPLPRPLSRRTEGGAELPKDLGYWRPGGNFVIFYRHDGLTVPSPGIVILGQVDSGAGIFDVPGPVEVTVELID